MRKSAHAISLSLLVSLGGCMEVTTQVTPSASGTLVDAATGKPIDGASISVNDHPDVFVQTTSDGQFSLAPTTRTTTIFWLAPYRTPPASGAIVVSADGYASTEIPVDGGARRLLVALAGIR